MLSRLLIPHSQWKKSSSTLISKYQKKKGYQDQRQTNGYQTFHTNTRRNSRKLLYWIGGACLLSMGLYWMWNRGIVFFFLFMV